MKFQDSLRVAKISALIFFALSSATARAGVVGFNNGVGWQANNSPVFFGQELFVTTVGNGDSNSAFYLTQQPINKFEVHYTYTDAANGNNGQNAGNGAAFVLQADPRGASAVGGDGGSGLGYQGITPSAAVEFNIDSIFASPVGTGLGLNGTVNAYATTGSLNLRSGDPIDVTLTYDGTTLTENLVDAVANTSYSRSFTVDLVAGIGNSAYIGFTGGSGLDTSTQVITNFSFNNVPEPSTGVLAAMSGIALLMYRCRRSAPRSSGGPPSKTNARTQS